MLEYCPPSSLLVGDRPVGSGDVGVVVESFDEGMDCGIEGEVGIYNLRTSRERREKI